MACLTDSRIVIRSSPKLNSQYIFTFATNLVAAGEQIQQLGGISDDGEDGSNTVDYDSMEKEELLDLCVERGMKTSFPKMKRIIIEELRFFDANGRQGKRHPVKNTLS